MQVVTMCRDSYNCPGVCDATLMHMGNYITRNGTNLLDKPQQITQNKNVCICYSHVAEVNEIFSLYEYQS